MSIHERAADMLDAAAKLIEATGLAKGWGVTYNEHGCPTGYCATGAVAAVAVSAGHAKTGHVVDHATAALAADVRPHDWHPTIGTPAAKCQFWNDRPERTRAQVVSAMRKTARRLRDGRQSTSIEDEAQRRAVKALDGCDHPRRVADNFRCGAARSLALGHDREAAIRVRIAEIASETAPKPGQT